MDVLDTLAFLGRRYERQLVVSSGSERFTMADVLQTFDRAGILELTPYVEDHARGTVKPDRVRKIKVSLLDDGLSAIHSNTGDWFEVFRTAPSGDLSKVRIVAHAPAGARVGEIRMLVGRRSVEHYFAQDPIIETIANRRD